MHWVSILKLYLIKWMFSVQRIFSSQHSGGEHDANENNVSEVPMVAQLMAKYAKPFGAMKSCWIKILQLIILTLIENK
jgi:hypothetical protein